MHRRPRECLTWSHLEKIDTQATDKKVDDDPPLIKKRSSKDVGDPRGVVDFSHQLASSSNTSTDKKIPTPSQTIIIESNLEKAAQQSKKDPTSLQLPSTQPSSIKPSIGSKVKHQSKPNKSNYISRNPLLERELLTDYSGKLIQKGKSPGKRPSSFTNDRPSKKQNTTKIASTLSKRDVLSEFPDPTKMSAEERKYHQWTELYRPRVCSDVVGNLKTIEKLREWMKKRQNKAEADLIILIHGPPGIGKTSTVHALFREFGFNIYEVNASIVRTAHEIHQELLDVVPRAGLKGRTAVILDELDGGVEKNTDETAVDCSAVNGILNFIKWTKDMKKDTSIWSPVVCIANDVTGKAMQRLSHSIPTFRFFKPFTSDLSKVLNRVLRIEKFKITENDKVKLIESASGDVRKLLVSLQLYASTPNTTIKSFSSMSGQDQYWDTFRSISILLYGQIWSWEQMFNQIQSDQSIAILMLQENYVRLFNEKFPAQGKSILGPTCEHNSTPKTCVKCKHQLMALNDMSEFADSFSIIEWFESSVPTYQEWHEETKNSMAGLMTSSIRTCRGQRHKGVDNPTIKFTSFFGNIKSRQSIKDIQKNLLAKHRIYSSGFKRIETLNYLRRTNNLVLDHAKDMENFQELSFV
jgi:DNA polymerase III delta prime subunit